MLSNDTIDRDRLRNDIRRASAECTALKRALRTRWTRPMADEQRRLARARRRATELFVLAAHLRGRRHVIAPPEDVRQAGASWDAAAWNARVAERVARDYVAAPALRAGEAPEAARTR